MNYREAVEYLNRHITHGMLPGLERISGLADLMGNPQDGYPIIHVGGTNGKTSVSRIASMLCVAHGLTTGTFTSPHLEVIQERLMLNGVVPSEDEFAQAVEDLAAFAEIFEERTSKVSFFELTAALAFSWFADQTVEAAVIEVGLGGRWDATNAADGDVAVITSIGFDHMKYLGNTLEEIATEKLQILKPESILVTGSIPESLDGLIEEEVNSKKATWYRYGRDFNVGSSERAVGGWLVDIEGVHGDYPEVFLPMHGRHQTVNLATSVVAVECLMGRSLDPAAVVEGVGVVENPGRMEILEPDPMVLVDGAHNSEGIATLVSALEEEYRNTRWVVVLAAMEDKELDVMLAPLARVAKSVVATAVKSPRAFSVSEVAEAARENVCGDVSEVPSPTDAVEKAKKLAGPGGGVLVTGSLYLVGTVRAYLGGRSYQPGER